MAVTIYEVFQVGIICELGDSSIHVSFALHMAEIVANWY